MKQHHLSKILAIGTMVFLSGCMDAGGRGLGPSCQSGVVAAERALGNAKANNLGRAIDWAKAAGLIAAARTQQQFSEYQNCALKAAKAREIIGRHK